MERLIEPKTRKRDSHQLFQNVPGVGHAVDWTILGHLLTSEGRLEVFATADAALATRFHSSVFAPAYGLSTRALGHTTGHGYAAVLAKYYDSSKQVVGAADAERSEQDPVACRTRGESGRDLDSTKVPEAFADTLTRLLLEEQASPPPFG